MVATTAVNPTGTLSGAGAAAVTITPSFSNGGFDTWREESRQGARLSVEFRVKCAEGFTGSTCTDTCPEPNDVNARYARCATIKKCPYHLVGHHELQ